MGNIWTNIMAVIGILVIIAVLIHRADEVGIF